MLVPAMEWRHWWAWVSRHWLAILTITLLLIGVIAGAVALIVIFIL
jgi:hypothetical protein